MDGKLAIQRAVASAGVLIAVSAVSITVASPASAVTADCVRYLQGKSYAPTTARINACYVAGHYSGWTDKAYKYQICVTELIRSDVRSAHAGEACDYAQDSA
ncbi:hypothetical protein GCM10010344_39130 [Streptomyces bluensis]|nr:hypothetical protein GCM10010344_39130 [Streptomyces bluensis]